MTTLLPRVEIGMRDASGSRSAVRLHMRPGTSVTAARAACASLRSLLSGISLCVPVDQAITYEVLAEPYPTSAPGSESADMVGLMVFACTVGYAGVGVPGIRAALVESTGDGAGLDLRITDSALAAFITVITGGLWVGPHASDIVALEVAYREERP